jgi:nucleotide-binding universal stress UspA family protein
LGWQVRPEAAATALAARASPRRNLVARVSAGILNSVREAGPRPGAWRREKLTARYDDRLFADILVPLSGQPSSWAALDQALEVAQREGAQLHGLHVVASEAAREAEAAQAVRAEFHLRCAAAGLTGLLAVEAGEVAPKICERGLLADLVVLNLAHPPPPQPLAKLESGFRAIIRHCARPILAVPSGARVLDRVLLAYDGGPKAQEALFVATYFAEVWDTPLTVVAVAEADLAPGAVLDRARAYLEFHEIQATFLSETGPVASVIMILAEAHDSHLIIMGGYGRHPVREVVLGSTVDEVLRQSRRPVLICR